MTPKKTGGECWVLLGFHILRKVEFGATFAEYNPVSEINDAKSGKARELCFSYTAPV